jgi:hypothetical protein
LDFSFLPRCKTSFDTCREEVKGNSNNQIPNSNNQIPNSKSQILKLIFGRSHQFVAFGAASTRAVFFNNRNGGAAVGAGLPMVGYHQRPKLNDIEFQISNPQNQNFFPA